MTPPSASNAQSPPRLSLKWAVAGILLLGILGRFIGLAREILIAGTFGTSSGLDAIYLGLSLPIALSIGIGSGISRALVPAGAAVPRSHLGGLLLQAIRQYRQIALRIALFFLLASPVLAWMMIPRGSPVGYESVTVAIALGGLGVVGACFAGCCIGLSNSHGRHFAASLTPLMHSVTVIVSVLLLSSWLGVYSLLVGVILAEWMQAIVLIPFVRGILAKVRFPGREALSTAQAIFWPSVILSMTGGLMTSIDRAFAAGLQEGSVSALSYADRLLNLPVMLIGLALQQPLYTRLARHAAERDPAAFERTLELGLRLLLLAGIPSCVLLTYLAEPLVGLLLQRGAFSPEATIQCATVLRGYAPGVVFLSMAPLLISAGLAGGKSWPVVFIYAGAMVLNGVLDAVFVGPYGLAGIALSTSCVAATAVLAMLALIAPRLMTHPRVLAVIVKAALVSCLYAAVLQLHATWFAPTGAGFADRLIQLVGGVLAAGLFAALPCLPFYRAELASLSRLAGRAAGNTKRRGPA